MVNGQFSFVIFHTIITIAVHFWSPATSQSVTRYLNEMETDEFPNPENSSCTNSGCIGAMGYKSCLNCCKCRCNYGSYLTINNKCVYDEDIAKGCKYVLGDQAYQYSVVPTSSQMLKAGQKISYCKQSWELCTTSTRECVINRNKTVYDDGTWKLLWPLESDVDFEIKRTSGTSDFLAWRAKDCNTNKYDGLLISFGVSCKVNGVIGRVNSCFVFKVTGSFIIGTDPLIRTNCTTTTSSPEATSSQATTSTIATTSSPLTTKYTPGSTHISTTLRSTTAPKTPTTQKKDSSKAVSSGKASTEEATTTADGKHRSSSSGTLKTTKATGFGENRKGDSNSKKVIIAAASLTLAGLLLVIFFAVAIVIIMKKRRKSSCERSQAREDSCKVNADSALSHCSPVLPMEANNGPSNSFWTVNSEGNFILAESAPVFTVHVPGEYDSPEEGLYDEPITRRTSSLGKLYAVVNKRKRSSKRGSDDGYSSIKDAPLPPERRTVGKLNSRFLQDSDAFSHNDQIWLQPSLPSEEEPPHVPQSFEDCSDVIYDQPETVSGNAENTRPRNGENSEPIYMLYEPFHK